MKNPLLRNIKSVFIIILLIMVTASAAFSQNAVLKGSVVDKTDGNPLPGANIQIFNNQAQTS